MLLTAIEEMIELHNDLKRIIVTFDNEHPYSLSTLGVLSQRLLELHEFISSNKPEIGENREMFSYGATVDFMLAEVLRLVAVAQDPYDDQERLIYLTNTQAA